MYHTVTVVCNHYPPISKLLHPATLNCTHSTSQPGPLPWCCHSVSLILTTHMKRMPAFVLSMTGLCHSAPCSSREKPLNSPIPFKAHTIPGGGTGDYTCVCAPLCLPIHLSMDTWGTVPVSVAVCVSYSWCLSSYTLLISLPLPPFSLL